MCTIAEQVDAAAILTMQAGWDLDALAAAEVLGWSFQGLPRRNQYGLCNYCGRAEVDDPRNRQARRGVCYGDCMFSDDLTSAWKLMDVMVAAMERGDLFQFDGPRYLKQGDILLAGDLPDPPDDAPRWYVRVGVWGVFEGSAWAPDPEAAITRAAVIAARVMKHPAAVEYAARPEPTFEDLWGAGAGHEPEKSSLDLIAEMRESWGD